MAMEWEIETKYNKKLIKMWNDMVCECLYFISSYLFELFKWNLDIQISNKSSYNSLEKTCQRI